MNEKSLLSTDNWNEPSPSHRKDNRVNFMADFEVKAILKKMADFQGLTQSAYLNELIKKDYKNYLNNYFVDKETVAKNLWHSAFMEIPFGIPVMVKAIREKETDEDNAKYLYPVYKIGHAEGGFDFVTIANNEIHSIGRYRILKWARMMDIVYLEEDDHE